MPALKLSSREKAIDIYLCVTAVIAAAFVAVDILDASHGFIISQADDWLTIIYLLWVPVSAIIIFLATTTKRIGAALVAAGVIFYMACTFAIAIAFSSMNPTEAHLARTERKAPVAFMILDLIVEPIIAISAVFLVWRYRRPSRKVDDNRLVKLDDS